MSDYQIERREGGWSRFFGDRREVVLGLLILLFTVGVFGFVIKDALVAHNKDKSGVRHIIAKRWNDRTLAFPIEGADRHGKRVFFDVVVLTKNYGWVRGSTTDLERSEQRLSPADIRDEVLAPQLREGLGSARGLIAVGLASQEGDVEREEQRGGLRAARTAHWVRDALGDRIPMWTLNLGRYLEPCAECEDADTSWQRPFIVIAIRQADAGALISEALADAMSNTSNLPSPDRYSAFAFAKFVK
ncbi:hypothetical protein DLM45_11965 [Hyphomicrobium methylovorum]|uniref:hypothetical protein n=1 Tax=Hyphomicrobium methylovorum TaxID=84 RepID=UPI0015E77BC8|nr:hypothetical protein [Hyphomicrobium methylovorum]MBA2126929.1 hypothetical protein [Hyphomicrobium methylovorum]